MTIRILVNGAHGKMGTITTKTIISHPEFALVGQIGHEDDLKSIIQESKAQIVIDFTHADSAFKNTETIIQAKAHPVIGTSGLKKNEVKELQILAEKNKIGGIIAPNFSLGAVLMMKAACAMVKFFPDVEIIEMHHAGKKDSPSGTAIKTAEMIAESRKSLPEQKDNLLETIKGARGASYENIPIHAIRLPGLVAHQEIIFGGVGEILTIRHDSRDRECFMPGVILACQKVLALDRLVYGLEHLI